MEDLIKMALPAGNGLLFTLFNLILVAVIVIALIITSMRSLSVQLITPQKTRSVSQSVSQSLHWRSLEVTGGHWRSLEVIGGHLRSLDVIGGHWRSLEVESDQSKACLDD